MEPSLPTRVPTRAGRARTRGLDIAPAITHRFPVREHEAAFAVARSGDSGKVILDWTA
jgi:threonine dehydrogenase-like Zn-dependent dehydrogenase